MNAPFALCSLTIRLADLRQVDETARIEGFVAEMGGSLFHRPAWIHAIEVGTGQRAFGLLAERGGALVGWLPLNEIHSPVFGRMLASSGFAVEGGILGDARSAQSLSRAAQELARRRSCTAIELRGGPAPVDWTVRTDSHLDFRTDLASDDEGQLLAVPRKQRAEVRKGLAEDLVVHTGHGEAERAEHYSVYCESVRNLGTPVFPRRLFDAALNALDGDILTVRHRGRAVASVLSFYHEGSVMPYWGGGVRDARRLRANDRMYFELLLHARRARGCKRADFGRSKTGSGAAAFKKNWGFASTPFTYSNWNAPGCEARDADPTSTRHASRIALWKRLPLPIANRLGPLIARGLG